METGWKTFGHANIRSVLEKQLGSGKFPHAYLFVGPEGVGKKHLALEFASRILGTENLNNHPDFSILDQEEEISVAQIREYVGSLGFKPLKGSYKVAVVNNAHLLNTQGGNALLKTLEEPSPSSIIILISSRGLLPTIVSRCQVFSFNCFTAKQVSELAGVKKMNLEEDLVLLCGGSAGKFMEFAGKPEKAREMRHRLGELRDLRGSEVSDRLLAVAKFSDFENEELQEIFKQWLYAEKSGATWDTKSFAALKAIMEALEELKTNKNKKLILQSLFLKI